MRIMKDYNRPIHSHRSANNKAKTCFSGRSGPQVEMKRVIGRISLQFRYNENMSIIKELQQKPRQHVSWMDIMLLVVLMAYVLIGTNLAPYHGDESTFISMSEDYDRIVKDRDFSHVLFDPKGNSKQYIRLSIGSILVFSIG